MKKREKVDHDDYWRCVQAAVADLRSGRFAEADALLRQAIALDYSRPEVYNALGIMMELQGNRWQAQNYYRAALSLDPGYAPSRNNLDRTVGLWKPGQHVSKEA
ncbi:MAG: hypothetical protein A2087_02135 [Spirochaetes bacterium GWD1_61_31]|nr:MAG: hypothetical protein A2Y37_11870 [Spirochaetes bacterium GWB1_60_80]OHD35687.1 MAG: hypothetical protein A2004_02985 [Spirochaetes bacterium GWC1_61_12]OHD43821.1 MAG: hypothetical protein A2087_02135 [Spirochaetes bacterium GWD1_61_31]OHD46064.1 MAG: hypothetical protein A2Y35_13695 [Spirochaetes bacterium GWE1_60_18]OHD60636.1 MAG: hypothetical protein A2Y32_08185 [Spirochaetes bacterium GWF1_60_12]HAP44253.1 hypothetical protein [Spirochaetaceae bacterium]